MNRGQHIPHLQFYYYLTYNARIELLFQIIVQLNSMNRMVFGLVLGTEYFSHCLYNDSQYPGFLSPFPKHKGSKMIVLVCVAETWNLNRNFSCNGMEDIKLKSYQPNVFSLYVKDDLFTSFQLFSHCRHIMKMKKYDKYLTVYKNKCDHYFYLAISVLRSHSRYIYFIYLFVWLTGCLLPIKGDSIYGAYNFPQHP